MGRPGQRLEAPRRNVATAPNTPAKRSVVEAGQCRVDLGLVLDRTVAQGEVALLFEDLAGGGGLGTVGHLLGRLDGLAELLQETRAFRRELGAECLRILWIHQRTVRAGRPSRRLALYSMGVPFSEAVMATQIDPVCGMEVDPTTSELSLEYNGTTYWFCGKGCLLEFRDDPETYLPSDHVPSM